MKKILIIAGSVIGIVVLILFSFISKMNKEMAKMTPVETKELFDKIYVIKDTAVNMYLIKYDEKYIAIDAGNKIEITEEELKKLKIDPDDVSTVLLTHTDVDHVGALSLFKNATVYFSRQEEQLLNGTTNRFFFIGNKICTENYKLLDDNQNIEIGNLKIQCILTPGHTTGSMCFLVNEKYLFTGDVLSLINGKVEVFNELFNMDTEVEKESIKKLTTLSNIEYVFTAHHGYSDNFVSAIKDWK